LLQWYGAPKWLTVWTRGPFCVPICVVSCHVSAPLTAQLQQSQISTAVSLRVLQCVSHLQQQQTSTACVLQCVAHTHGGSYRDHDKDTVPHGIACCFNSQLPAMVFLRHALCTSGDPVSPGARWYSSMMSCFRCMKRWRLLMLSVDSSCSGTTVWLARWLAERCHTQFLMATNSLRYNSPYPRDLA
jgi:hypothetical protein